MVSTARRLNSVWSTAWICRPQAQGADGPNDRSQRLVMPDEIDVSVIVPAYNAAATIEAQLRALSRQSTDMRIEVIVVDNGSTDRTKETVGAFAAAWPAVRLVDGSQVRGPAWARNFGATVATGRLLLFCDADDIVGDDWLRAMVRALSCASLVTGPQELRSLNPEWLRGAYGFAAEKDLQWFAGTFPFGPSANLGVHRDLFVANDGFDQRLQVGEDIDLCLRLWHRGIEIAFVQNAPVHYRYRQSLRGLWRQARSYGVAAPELVRRCEALDHPVRHRLRGLKAWIWLVRSAPGLRHRAGRVRWVVVAGGAFGRVLGSLRSRTLFL